MGWFVCVVGGDVYAALYLPLALLLYRKFVVANPDEWKLVVLVTFIGVLWDSVMISQGVLVVGEGAVLSVPVWLVCLWVLFATTLRNGLYWMNPYLVPAALVAGVAGPASYWTGTILSDASLGEPSLHSLAILAIGWAFILPFGLYLARRIP